MQLGFFNEADTLESSSILIYLFQAQSIYTRKGWHKAILIKISRHQKGQLKVTSVQLIKSFN